MSAALQERPRAGDRVRADVRRRASEGVSTRSEMITLPDGCMVLTADDLALLGNGDASAGRRELRLMLEMERDRSYVHKPVTERPKNVRGATEKDEQALLALFMKDVAENAAHVAVPHEESVLEVIQAATRNKRGIIGVIDGPDGKPAGACIIHYAKFWWSKSWFLQDIALYVDSDHRKSGYINDLLEFQKWVSDETTKGFGYTAPLICGVLGTHRVRSKIMLYRRKFRQVGAGFMYPSPYERDTPTS